LEKDLEIAYSNSVPEQFLTKTGKLNKTIKPKHWLNLFGTPNINSFLKNLSEPLRNLNWELIPDKKQFVPKWSTQAINCQSVSGHLLVQLKWNDQHLLFSRDRGFYLSNGNDLPHPKKGDKNVVRLFSKNFFEYFDKEIITSDSNLAEDILGTVMKTSFWVGNQSRFNQAVDLVPNESGDLLLLPEIVSIGTTTRRASSKIWHVLPKPSSKKLGSGFMSFIKPSKGHVILHADLDSVEAVIAALYNLDRSGKSNIFTESVIYGVKENDTDVHSINAKMFNIPRSAAKAFLYSSLYGSGIKGLATTLLGNNPSLGLSAATDMATQFLNGLRGSKKDGFYVGGTASRCFNYLIELTKKDTAGFLNSDYSHALKQDVVNNDFFTSRANAGIQSVGRMMLDIWLTEVIKKSPWIEFYYSVHDQLIFNCPEEKVELAIQSIQESHKNMYMLLFDFLAIKPIENLFHVTSVIQDTRLGKTASSKGKEYFRSSNHDKNVTMVNID
jgi:DNA polymerase gamma 1